MLQFSLRVSLLCVCAIATTWLAPLRAQVLPPASTVTGSAQLTLIGFRDTDGLRYDHVLLNGAQANVDPADGTVARTFFLDRNGDIVAVDFTGAGSITFAFESFTSPAPATLYNQSTNYLHGHPVITVTGSNATSKLKIFSLGRATVADQTIFRENALYDGIADIQRIAVAVDDAGGEFGSIDAGNVRFSGTTGVTGIVASRVRMAGAVSLYDVKAEQSATPSLRFGTAQEVRVLGGDLLQPNGRSVGVQGVTLLTTADGATSHGVVIPARSVHAMLNWSAVETGVMAVNPASGTFQIGQSGSLAIIGYGSPAPTFSLANGTLPVWANLNATTGIITGSPSGTVGSPFTFAVRVANGIDSPAIVNVTLAVEPAPAVPPVFLAQPAAGTVQVGGQLTLSANASGTPAPSYQWRRNGASVSGADQSTLSLVDFGPDDAGYYSVVATNSAGATESNRVFIGAAAATKLAGSAEEVGPDIVHPNGNRYDQMLLTGSAALIKAEDGDITRISFIDLSHDIVQVEFSGAGTLSVSLDGPTVPARPEFYNQAVEYVRGHARIVITGANETSYLTIFTVGRITAGNQSLFREGVDYDGVADIASIAISSTDGKFGAVRAANVSFADTTGWVGLYAPGVAFSGPVFIGDIAASEGAEPVIILGAASEVRITGGDLQQPNERAVAVKGIATLQFRNGSSSHGDLFPAQANQGRLEQDGVDVTAEIASAPTP